jgi:predicted lipase
VLPLSGAKRLIANSFGQSGATGYVAADKTKKKIVVALRGSVNIQNWISDIKFLFQECPEFGQGAKCEIGFYSFWTNSKYKINNGIEKALKENPDFGIVVTGHSLGGAAAVYAAGELRKKYPDVELVRVDIAIGSLVVSNNILVHLWSTTRW